jgi:kynurenine formamidase
MRSDSKPPTASEARPAAREAEIPLSRAGGTLLWLPPAAALDPGPWLKATSRRPVRLVPFPGLASGEAIACKSLVGRARERGGVQEGDPIFILTGRDERRRRGDAGPGPALDFCSVRWLISEGASLVGIDAAGVDPEPGSRRHLDALLDEGIAVLAGLSGLEALAGRGPFSAEIAIAGAAEPGASPLPVAVLARAPDQA